MRPATILTKTSIILSQARKYNVGMILAHQFLGQLEPRLHDAIAANTAIKFAGGVSAKDARALSNDLRTDAGFIESQEKFHFAGFIKGQTQRAVGIMSGKRALTAALSTLAANAEQLQAAQIKDHCVVLAGPGSGKTKTLTTAMLRTLLEDVDEPRGVACITYNNECAFELEKRLAALGLERGARAFIGTVHGFALSQIILPFARCVFPDWPSDLSLISESDKNDVIFEAYAEVVGDGADPKKRWEFASEKRKSEVDRSHPKWRGAMGRVERCQ